MLLSRLATDLWNLYIIYIKSGRSKDEHKERIVELTQKVAGQGLGELDTGTQKAQVGLAL